MIDWRYMTREELNELSIFALREFARRTGVYAPTSKKKNELIDEIIDISEGKKQPYIAKTKQGRPPKNYGYPFAESFIGTPVQTYPSTCLRQETQFVYNDDIKTVSAYLEICNDSAMLWSYQNEKLVCLQLAKGLAQDYNLRTGDLILAEVGGENHNIAVSILSVNNIPIKLYNRVRRDYSKIEHQIPNQDLTFMCDNLQGLNIKLGESVYLYGSSNVDNSLTIADMLKNCNVDRKLYVNVSIVDKNRYVLKLLVGVEKFVTNFADPIDDARRVVMLATERAKRIMEKGETCVLAIDDVQSVCGVDMEDLHVTKNIISLTKNGDENSSITLFAIMPSSRCMDIFEKLADKRFKVLDRKLLKID